MADRLYKWILLEFLVNVFIICMYISYVVLDGKKSFKLQEHGGPLGVYKHTGVYECMGAYKCTGGCTNMGVCFHI